MAAMYKTLYNEFVNLIRHIAIVFFSVILALAVLFPTTLYAQQVPSIFDTAKKAYIATLNTYRDKEQQFSIAH